MNKETTLYNLQLEEISKVLPEVSEAIKQELTDQRSYLKMIASENYCSSAVRAAEGTIFTDKYAEGYPEHRFYAGCENVDRVEKLAADLACELFDADYAYVQPHSGADANMCAYWAILDAKVLTPAFQELQNAYAISPKKKEIKTYSDLTESEWNYLRTLCHNQKLLSLDYYSGSHLTHGYRQNTSAQLFDCYYYKTRTDTGLIDYDRIEQFAMAVKPLILLAGYSAYTRKLNFRRFREIADNCGAVLMVDMAHFAGLVAGKQFTDDYDPVKWADIVTTTTHKTLRGPRGGMILCKDWLKDSVNKGCPLVLGGPLENMIAAKAVAFKEALSPDFQTYARKVIKNAQTLADVLTQMGLTLVTGGTENHMVLIDVSPLGITGRQAEAALRECGITCNRNAIPGDPNGPWYTSGIRLGTPALTTLGMEEAEVYKIAVWIGDALKSIKPAKTSSGAISKTKYTWEIEGRSSIFPASPQSIRAHIQELLKQYPAYPELYID